MWTILKVFIEFVTILLLPCVLNFCLEACGSLTPRPGIELILPALEGKVLTTGCPGKNPELILRNHYIRQILSRVLDARDAIVEKKKRGKKQTLKLFLEQRAGQCG